MVDRDGGVQLVVHGLRERRHEIEERIYTRVREAVRDPVANSNEEYLAGLRAAVAAAVDYGLGGIEDGVEPSSMAVPREAMAQARLAARSGVNLDAVLQRYIVGHSLLWDLVMEEADRAGPPGGALREMSRAQSALLERLTSAVAQEYGRERERMGRSREQRLAESVRALLAGDEQGGAIDTREWEADYELDAEHLGVIAKGETAVEALRGVAARFDRQLLCVAQGQGTVWGWLGGQRTLRMSDLRRALEASANAAGMGTGGHSREERAALAVGEPARGLAGWRATHRQAQAALLVALRRPAPLTCYADVALLAAALKDRALGRALLEIFVSPLGESHNGSSVLRQTLRAYLAAEGNASSAAAALGVARSTVEKRLRIAEERLGRVLRPCPVELEVALTLDALEDASEQDVSSIELSSD